jgi:NAD(P)-dependent dehydrogenase (short-subunit alcohol dehydrogenase family)
VGNGRFNTVVTVDFGTVVTVDEERSMAWSARDIPDLTDRVAVVTEATSGPGLGTVRELAAAGAHVVITARDAGGALDATEDIQAEVPNALISIVAMDLTLLDSVHTAARTIVAAHERIDILINNAAVAVIPRQRSADWSAPELNPHHLGHFALTAGLLPALLRAEAARVVSLAGAAHHFGRPVDPAEPAPDGRSRAGRSPGPSRRANYHFAVGLHRLFTAAHVPAASLLADPGPTRGPAGAALPQLRAATDPSARSGQFYAARFVRSGSPVRRPVLHRAGLDRAVQRLWSVSEQLTGVRLDLAAVRAAAQT